MENYKYDAYALKSEEMKYNAFFSYLRAFSETGIDTLQKLESDFNKQMRIKKSQEETLGIMKNLLSAYQIFILQLKDSCDFVELSDFGFCIGKTFVQLLKIIKWFLRSWLKNSKRFEEIKERLSFEESRNAEQWQDRQAVCAFCQQILKQPPVRNGKSKRKGVALNDLNSQLSSAKKRYFEEKNYLASFQDRIFERYTMKDINSKRYISQPGQVDVLNKKYAELKCQFSNNANVLEQVLNDFNLKTEAISRFVHNSQIMGMEEYKMASDISFEAFAEEMKARIAQKYQEAREKLKDFVNQKIENYQRLKLSRLVDKAVQTSAQDNSERQKTQMKIKQLQSTIGQLKNDLEGQKALNESLKELLQSKAVAFQEEFLNYRKQLIMNYDIKSKSNLKSLKSIRDLVQQDDAQKQNKTTTQQPRKLTSGSSLRLGGLMRSKERSTKKKHSIRFTFENQSVDQEDKSPIDTVLASSRQQQSLVQRIQNTTVGVQTDLTPELEQASPKDKKFYLIERQNHQLRKSPRKIKESKSELKLNKMITVEQAHKRTSSNIYSHVKSRVYNNRPITAIPKSPLLNKKLIEPNVQISNLVKKLANNYHTLYNQVETETVKCEKMLIEPIFTRVTAICFTQEDICNLFLGEKNAHNYQCLLYRNSIFNQNNLNPKRAVNYTQRIAASDRDWQFKKQFETADSLENKLSNSIFYQVSNIKKKQKHVYESIKVFLRFPAEMCHNVQIYTFEKNREEDVQELTIGEIKKMMNIILRFHQGCLQKHQGSLCEHLNNFCNKIGMKLC